MLTRMSFTCQLVISKRLRPLLALPRILDNDVSLYTRWRRKQTTAPQVVDKKKKKNVEGQTLACLLVCLLRAFVDWRRVKESQDSKEEDRQTLKVKGRMKDDESTVKTTGKNKDYNRRNSRRHFSLSLTSTTHTSTADAAAFQSFFDSLAGKERIHSLSQSSSLDLRSQKDYNFNVSSSSLTCFASGHSFILFTSTTCILSTTWTQHYHENGHSLLVTWRITWAWVTQAERQSILNIDSLLKRWEMKNRTLFSRSLHWKCLGTPFDTLK